MPSLRLPREPLLRAIVILRHTARRHYLLCYYFLPPFRHISLMRHDMPPFLQPAAHVIYLLI